MRGVPESHGIGSVCVITLWSSVQLEAQVRELDLVASLRVVDDQLEDQVLLLGRDGALRDALDDLLDLCDNKDDHVSTIVFFQPTKNISIDDVPSWVSAP